MTLNVLLAKHGIKEIDLLQIDAEGFDWKVLQTLDVERMKPTIIQLEYGHLPRQALTEMTRRLDDYGYELYFGSPRAIWSRCVRALSEPPDEG